MRRAFQIGVAVCLAIGISGLAPAVSEAIAIEHGDCCSDCDDPGCADQDEEECPPQCDDCVCPCWVVPFLMAAPSPELLSPLPRDVAYVVGELAHEAPLLRGIFRPPRLSA